MFVFAPVQHNWACFKWKGALEIRPLLSLLLVMMIYHHHDYNDNRSDSLLFVHLCSYRRPTMRHIVKFSTMITCRHMQTKISKFCAVAHWTNRAKANAQNCSYLPWYSFFTHNFNATRLPSTVEWSCGNSCIGFYQKSSTNMQMQSFVELFSRSCSVLLISFE